MLYHYTDADSMMCIMRDGVIRARAMTLHRDWLARDAGLPTAPIVWLTINPILDGTIVAKMRLDGMSIDRLCRIVLPHEYAPLGLAEWCEASGIALQWCERLVQTGQLAGSNYTTWRILGRDIPRSDWLSVERLAGMADGATQWEKLIEE